MRDPRVIALTGVLVLGTGGCGGGQDPGEATPDTAAVETAVASGRVDACKLLTAADATALFGRPASPQEGMTSVSSFGQCLWTWDSDTSNQLLQFYVLDPLAYSRPEDAEDLDLGDQGYVRAHPLAGVDIAWLQGGRMINLSYSTVGPDAPPATSRTEEVKALARQVAGRL